MNGPLFLTPPPVKRNRSSSASTALQPHRTQHPGAVALSARSSSSTLTNREPSSLATTSTSSSSSYLPEPPSTPKDPSRCSTRRSPSSVWSQFVGVTNSVWQSAQHPPHWENTSDTPSSPSSTATPPLLSPLLSSPTHRLFPLPAFTPDSPSERLLTSTSDLETYYPILLVILLFPISSAVVLATLSTLPIPNHFPKTIADVRQLGHTLQAYSESGWSPLLHVIAALCLTGLWKHAWSIPGAAVLNVLTGILLPPIPATILQTTITTGGSLLSSLLATPVGPLVVRFFPKALILTKSALQGPSPSTSDISSSSKPTTPVWVRLSIMRLVGIVPWSGINIACGVTGVSVWDCAVGAFIGSLPWTAVTCQIGDILRTFSATLVPGAQSLSTILFSPGVVLKLVFLTLLSLAPVLYRERLTRLLGSGNEDNAVGVPAALAEPASPRCSMSSTRTHKSRFSIQWWRRSTDDETEEVEITELRLEMA